MDQVRIGKFIAQRRRDVGLTQMQLAEKLDITDRAVSKWETGRSLPDSAIMLELCDVLKITVNDLLCGEVVTMENYNKELENNLLEMVKEKEQADRRLLKMEVLIGILSCVVMFVPIFIGALVPIEKDWVRLIIILSGLIPGVIGFLVALKLEQVAGFYECQKCGHRYVPTYKAVNLAMHMGRTRYMQCPKCGGKSWQQKRISKESDNI